jgi:tRNA1Val (adenine37-N6)-methyltransferase
MDFTEILRGIKIVNSVSKPTHASAFLVWFARPSASSRKILELGSGSGVVSIALAKIYKREVLGIEIFPELVNNAEKSAEINGVSDRVKFIQGDIKNTRKIVEAESFDMVVSNPPHHIGKDKSPDVYRAFARSADFDTIEIFTDAIFWSLKNGGEYALVLSPENLVDWIYALKQKRLEPKKMVFFHPKDKAELVALKGKKNAKSGLIVDKPLF